ncbi:rhodanese-like domain-containing protein [Hydrogenimonas sp. SS33]|uniref:rhodanese-like domain-containing protein n=1 Tax=Hydrogenimonas leucolamina TaxID=2954236 RepID=UPI00336BC639
MKKSLFFITLLLAACASLFAEEMAYNDDVTAKDAAEMMQKEGAILIDVRDPVEFLYVGHAAGSVNIPVFFVRVDMPPVKIRMKVAAVERKEHKAVHPLKTYRPLMDENKKFVENVKKAVHGKLDAPIIVMCRSGERSVYAANKLAKNGFDNVYNLEDGYIFGWRASGLPSGGE